MYRHLSISIIMVKQDPRQKLDEGRWPIPWLAATTLRVVVLLRLPTLGIAGLSPLVANGTMVEGRRGDHRSSQRSAADSCTRNWRCELDHPRNSLDSWDSHQRRLWLYRATLERRRTRLARRHIGQLGGWTTANRRLFGHEHRYSC